MVIEVVDRAVFWLNAFPHPNGVSNTMSPCSLASGRMVDHNKHCKYEFGQYVQVHNQHNNSMQPHMTGAVALHPTGKTQGCRVLHEPDQWKEVELSTCNTTSHAR